MGQGHSSGASGRMLAASPGERGCGCGYARFANSRRDTQIMIVVSGGQTGADQAGWRAAKAAGFECADWMPKGYLTEDGPRPEFAWMYGAVETASSYYQPRTRLNAQEADITLWFGDPTSPGGRLTFKHAKRWYEIESPDYRWKPCHIAQWLRTCKVVNVSGNRESKAPGIGVWVEVYLAEVFRILKAKS